MNLYLIIALFVFIIVIGVFFIFFKKDDKKVIQKEYVFPIARAIPGGEEETPVIDFYLDFVADKNQMIKLDSDQNSKNKYLMNLIKSNSKKNFFEKLNISYYEIFNYTKQIFVEIDDWGRPFTYNISLTKTEYPLYGYVFLNGNGDELICFFVFSKQFNTLRFIFFQDVVVVDNQVYLNYFFHSYVTKGQFLNAMPTYTDTFLNLKEFKKNYN